jgi:hypothetical protein
MSGPPALIDAGRRSFVDAGLPEERLFYDSFDYAPDVLALIRRAPVSTNPEYERRPKPQATLATQNLTLKGASVVRDAGKMRTPCALRASITLASAQRCRHSGETGNTRSARRARRATRCDSKAPPGRARRGRCCIAEPPTAQATARSRYVRDIRALPHNLH